MKGKKGISEGFINFFIILTFILMFIIFYLLMAVSGGNAARLKLLGMQGSVEANDVLVSALASDVDVFGERMDLAELIARASVDLEYRRIVRSEILKVVSQEGIMQYDVRVQFPAESAYSAGSTFDERGSMWRGKPDGPVPGSYYVGEWEPSRKEVQASAVLPGPSGELIEVSLFSYKDHAKDIVHSRFALIREGLIQGEIIEDERGRKIVFWNIEGRVFLSESGVPCESRLSDKGVVCSDGTLPESKGMMLVAPFLAGNDLPPSAIRDSSQAEAGSQLLEFLKAQELGKPFTLVISGHDVEWMSWGRMKDDLPVYYYAKMSDVYRICGPKGVIVRFQMVFCVDGGTTLNYNPIIVENRALFRTAPELRDAGYSI